MREEFERWLRESKSFGDLEFQKNESGRYITSWPPMNLMYEAWCASRAVQSEHIAPVVRSNATTGWIKVSDRLPEIDIPVLVIIPDVHYPAYAFRANNADEYMVYYINGVKRCNTITYWMPLPEPPEV